VPVLLTTDDGPLTTKNYPSGLSSVVGGQTRWFSQFDKLSQLQSENTLKVVPSYTIVTAVTHPEIMAAADAVINAAWPEFMLHDPVANRYWEALYQSFPAFQFALIEDATQQIMAVGNSLPLRWDAPFADLPVTGWDWVLARGFEDHAAGRAPNIQSALSISIAPAYRSVGLSTHVVQAMTVIGKAHGLAALIAPVRPNLKPRYPLTPMEHYIHWQNADGTPFDAWIRVHVRLGADIIKICSDSMRIEATVATWEQWTGMRFPETGDYIVSGALVPVHIDCEADCGLYLEPNVWMRHPIMDSGQ